MIISREQRLNNDMTEAFSRLKQSLTTPRGTSEARAEMYRLREQSFKTNECPYCRSSIADRSPRRSEACMLCASKIDRILMMKSKILNAHDASPFKSKALDTFVKDLSSLEYVPVSIGGERIDEIIDNCTTYQHALQEIEDYKHEKQLQQTAANLKARRMANLRLEYSRYISQMSEEEFNDMLETIYVQRYYQDVV